MRTRPAPSALATTHPERVREDHRQRRERDPVDPEPEECRQEVSVAVHVRVDDLGTTRIQVELVLEPEVRQSEDDQEQHAHREVAEILVVHQRVDDEREHRRQQVAAELQHEQLEQVMAEFDAREAVQQLDRDAADQHDREQDQLQREHRDELRAEAEPGRRRHAVDDVVHARVALAPDQLAGIDRRHDQHERAEQPRHHVEHLVGQRIGVGAVVRAERDRVADHEQHAAQHDRQEARTAHDLAEIEPGEPGQHAEVGTGATIGRGDRQRDVGPLHGRNGDGLRALRLACRRDGFHAERAIAPQRHREPQTQPDRAIPQQHAGRRQLLGVLLRDAPVTRQHVDRRGPGRIDQRGERLVVHVADEIDREQVADQRDHAGHVHRRHLPRQRGQHEEAAAQPQQVGDQHDQVGPREVLPVGRRHDACGVDAGPVRADQHADHDAREDQHQRQVRAEEPSEEVVALADRRAEEEVVDADLEVLLDRATADRADHRDAGEAEDRDADRERVRAVDEDLVAAEIHRGGRVNAPPAAAIHKPGDGTVYSAQVNPGRQHRAAVALKSNHAMARRALPDDDAERVVMSGSAHLGRGEIREMAGDGAEIDVFEIGFDRLESRPPADRPSL